MRIFSFYLLIAFLLISGSKEIAMAADGSLARQIAKARTHVANYLLDLRREAEKYLATSSETKNDTNSTANIDSVLSMDKEEIFPLLESDVLDEVAETLCAVAISQGLDNIETNATRTFLEETGYKANAVHADAVGIIMKEYIQPDEGSRLLLKSLVDTFSNDLLAGEQPALLDNQYKEIGVGFCGGTTKVSELQKANAYILVTILANPKGPQPQWVQCGHVYYDLNNNHSYDPGEGLRDVLLSDGNGTLLAKTLNSGEYCFKRPKGNWILYIETFPFVQDYTNYNILLGHRKDGILWHDYPLLLTQGAIDAQRKNADEGKE